MLNITTLQKSETNEIREKQHHKKGWETSTCVGGEASERQYYR